MSTALLYLILKADDIRGLLIGITILFAVAIATNFFNFVVFNDTPKQYDEMWPITKKIFFYLIPSFFIFLVLAVICPTTKQAAVLYALPKIVNSETIQQESRELYDLAKQGLERLAGSAKEE